MATFTINHGHLSGYWNVDLKDFIAADHKLRAENDIVTYTETTKDIVVAYLRGLTDWGFSAAMDNERGECAVGWNKAIYKHVRTKVHVLTDLFVFTEDGVKRAPVTLRRVTLRHRKTRRKVIVAVVHMVSGVETWLREHHIADIDRQVTDHRSNVWLDCARSLRRIIRNVIRWNSEAVMIFGGDWNLDHHKEWVRNLTAQVGMNFFSAQWVNLFTHADRTIDVFRHRKCYPMKTKVYPKFAGFDHSGWSQKVQSA